MYELDEEHSLFIIDRGMYYYKVMPCGLKNVGATYQRLVNMMFTEEIGKTIKVYVDDMLVTSVWAQDHVRYLDRMFNIARKYGIRLNSLKCTFGVKADKFLGFVVHQKGI